MKTFSHIRAGLLCLVLLAGCTRENQTDNGGNGSGEDTGDQREVLMTLNNQLVLQKKDTKAKDADASTKAGTPIATAAENAIATLDVYVFGAKTENGDYSFQERFAYRSDGKDKLPRGASELQLTTTEADGKKSTALLKLKKGLFVKLYCIANDTALFNPATNKKVLPADYTPITFSTPDDGYPQLAKEGVPLESAFVSWHTRLLTTTAKGDTLATPLAMAGAYATPLDLTDFENSVRVQLSFRLTRLTARFDIENTAEKSRFTIEQVSLGNGRRGSGFFPIRVYGDLPEAKAGQLITWPERAFSGDKANKGLATGAFYLYPSPKEDKAFLILKGRYRVNATQQKEVSYQIPFTQRTLDGRETWIDIANNHRYTLAITAANEYHLDADLSVADWADNGNIDFTPDNKPGELAVVVPDAFKDETEFDEKERTVSMSIKNGSTIEISTLANATVNLEKIYAGGNNLYNWMTIDKPATTLESNGYTRYVYTVRLTPDYKAGRYPRTTLRFRSLADGSESLLFIEALAVPQPIETKQPPKAPNGSSNNPNSFDNLSVTAKVYRITGSVTQVNITCPDGVEVEKKPDWLDIEKELQKGAETTFNFKLNNRDVVVPGDIGTVTLHNMKKPSLKTDVVVNLMPAPVTPGYDAIGDDKGNTLTPGTPDTGAGATPDDLSLVIKADNEATVKSISMDGVSVKIKYPDGSPEWLRHNGTQATKAVELPAATTTAAALPGTLPATGRSTWVNKTEYIKFEPIPTKLAKAKTATVTFINKIGGEDFVFTITPEMEPAIAKKGTETPSVPSQDVFDTDKKTAVLYQLPGEYKDKSMMQLAVYSLGGSALTIEGTGAGISPDESMENNFNYVLRPTLADGTDEADITLHAKNYTDADKVNNYAVSVRRSNLKADKTAVTLTAANGTTVTVKGTSHEGFTIDKSKIVWQPEAETGGSQWFNVPTLDFAAGKDKVVNFTANTTTATGTALIRPAVVTLKNKIANGGDLKVTVTPAYTVPTLTVVGAADPTQNTLTNGTAATATLKMYQVANSKITIRAKAIGGSYSGNATAGISVSGGNTYKTENDYVVTIQAGTKSGSFKIYNKSNNTQVQTVNVTATSAVMTATANTNLGVTLNGSVSPAVTSPEGFKTSVNWGGGNAWFNLNKNDYPNTDKNVKATVPGTLGNISIKKATVTMTNKIRGGANLTFTISPTMGTPTLTKTASSVSGSLPTANNSALANNATLTLYKIDASNSTMTVRGVCYGGTKPVISGSNLSVNNNNALTNNTTYDYTITSTSNNTTGKLIVYNSDNTKSVTLNITVKDGEIRLDKTDVRLYPKTGQTATIKVTTATGVQSWSTTSWGSGGVGSWYSLPGAPGAGAPNMTLTAANQNANQRQATVTLVNKIAGCPNKTFTVSPDFKAPEVTTGTSATLKAGQNGNIPSITISGNCPGGCTISGPAWLTYNTTSTKGATYSYTLSLVPSKSGFPTSVPGNQTISIENLQSSSLKQTVTVNVTEDNAWIASDLSGYDNAGETRVGTAGRTLTVAVWGMFVTPNINNNYNGTYCNGTNGGNTWLNNTKLAKTEIVNNRRKYTFNVVVNAASGTDAAYQYHEASPQVRYGNTVIKTYKIIRGVSPYSYPAGSGSPYYCALPLTGKWWAPVDVGANEIMARSHYYQWGARGDYYLYPGCKVVNGYCPGTACKPQEYLTGTGNPTGTENWTSASNRDDLWQNGFQDPCPDGYRVPTIDELKLLAFKTTTVNTHAEIQSERTLIIYLPFCGYLQGSSNLIDDKKVAVFWTSTSVGNKAQRIYFNINNQQSWNADPKTSAFNLRCVRK